ncbi:MAG: DNA adenine methylase [Muribaculaceae bacterium]|nr:DNA adenine methylase [Muribaculaceae bacterium]
MIQNLFHNDYLGFKFPKPQYLGAKFIHREWIAQHIPESVNTVLDAFGGSQSVAYLMKQLGKRTLTNDFMSFNNHIGKALVENPNITLSSNDTDILFSENCNPEVFNLMESLFTDLFFTREEAAFADSFRSNVNKLDNPYKQSLALTIMCRSMTRKVTMGHFAHTQALNYAADPARIKRNRSLIRPLKELFIELLPQYNAAVFDNREKNISYNENILDLLPKLEGVDLVYFDPPYCDSHADYQSFYHLLETFVEYWKDKRFVNGTKRYEPKRFSGFDRNSEAVDNLHKMFELSQSVPIWLVSYNDRSYPDIDTMIAMIEPYRNVEVERKTYSTSRGGKGSVAGSCEILLICTPKYEHYEQL